MASTAAGVSPVPVGVCPASRFVNMRSSRVFLTCAIATAVFTEAYLYAVVGPIFPYYLADNLGVAQTDIQTWTTILFSMEAVGVLLAAPVFGFLSDKVANRKIPLLFGGVILIASHTMLCLAKNLVVLVIGRFMQGASAGAVWCLGLALLADNSTPDHVGRTMAYVTAAYSLASLVAPSIGGVVYEHAGYYAVFGVGYAIIAIDLTLRVLLIEPKRPASDLTAGLTSISPNLSPVPIIPGSAMEIESEVSVECSSAEKLSQDPFWQNIAIHGYENTSADWSSTRSESKTSRKPFKTLPIFILLKSRRVQVNFLINTVNAMILSGFDVTLPLFVQAQFQWTAQGAGLIFLAIGAPTFLQVFYGYLVDRFGPRWPAASGVLLLIAPFVCFRFVTDSSTTQKILLCCLLFIIGVGTSLTLAATMAEFTLVAVEKEKKNPGSMGPGGAFAQSYSLFDASWAIGSVAGSNFAGEVSQRAGWSTMGWSFALLCALLLIPTICYCGGWIGQKRLRQIRTWYGSADSAEGLV